MVRITVWTMGKSPLRGMLMTLTHRVNPGHDAEHLGPDDKEKTARGASSPVKPTNCVRVLLFQTGHDARHQGPDNDRI